MSMTVTPGLSADRIREREEGWGNASEVNLGDPERLASGIGGAALMAAGVRHGGWGGVALALLGGTFVYRGLTGYCAVYDNLGVESAGKRREDAGRDVHKGVLSRATVTINRPAEEIYRYCRDFENLPRFMKHVLSVQALDETHSRWTVRTPFGNATSDAEILNDRPNELIAWKTVEGSDVSSAGTIRLRPAPGNRGTELTLEYNIEPPAGVVGLTVAKLLGQDPGQRLRDDLRRFKQIMEAGEVATVEGQTSCRSRRLIPSPRQPSQTGHPGTYPMKALCWHGKGDVRVETVPDPKILNPRDAIVRITTTAICGSDLHLYDGYIPTMQPGDILGHEFMGEVVEVGREVEVAQGGRPRGRAVHDLVAAGAASARRTCARSATTRTPTPGCAEAVVRLLGGGSVRLLAHVRRLRGRPGGIRPRAVRRRRAARRSPSGLARRAGALPVRHLPDRLHGGRELQHPAGRHRRRLGLRAGRPVRDPERLPARGRAGDRHRLLPRAAPDGPSEGKAETLNYEEVDVYEALREITGGRGPDVVHRRRRAGGARPHGRRPATTGSRRSSSWRPTASTPCGRRSRSCRKGGTVSIPGVYGGLLDKFPIGAAFAKGLTFKMGQTHVQRYPSPLLERIQQGEIDPSFVITHRIRLDEAAEGYATFKTTRTTASRSS